ncbi:MAG: hypothetical protein EBR82_49145 [Caulobacteraceae bacterium]|nr:hypothetical protein [Caulobacteraceae bacterium]
MAVNNTALVKVMADNTQLTKELADTKKQLKGFERAANRAGKNTRSTFRGTAAGVGAAGVAAIGAAKGFDFLKDSVKTTESLTKAAMKLSSITGADVSTSAQFVQMTQARGISTKQLTTSMVTLSKQMTQAGKGSGKAAQAFAKLGVSQDALKRGDTTAVMMQLSDGLKNIKSPSEKAALAQQMLGRSGKDMLKVLSGGSGVLKEQLGMYKDSSDTIARNKDSVANLAGNQRKLNAAMDGLKVSLGTLLIPLMSRASDVIVRFSNLSPGVKKLLMAIVGFAAATLALGKLVTAVKAVLGAFKLLTAVPKILLAVRHALWMLKVAMLANPFILFATIAVAAGVLIWKNWGRIKGWLVGAFRAIKNAFVRVAQAVMSWARRGFLGPVGWIITNWSRVVSFFSGLPGRLGGYARRAGNAIREGIVGGVRGIAGLVSGALSGLGGIVRSAVNGIVSRANGIIRTINSVSSKVGFSIPLVPAMAEGGIVTRPTLALIGEAGPEAVVPLSGRNGRKARAAGFGGGQTIQNFTINTTGSVDEEALAAKIGWQLATRGLA